MANIRTWKLDETDRDVTLAVMLEADNGKSHFGVRHITLLKTATPAEVTAAILQARAAINADPVGGVEHVARVVADRINAGDIP